MSAYYLTGCAVIGFGVYQLMKYFSQNQEQPKKPKMDDLNDFTNNNMSDGSDDEFEQSSSNNNGAVDDAVTAANKLKHNIAKKGANSYYYAHAKKADAPTVRNEPPQLLEKTTVVNVAKTPVVQPFEKFAWANGTKTVSVYLTIPNADKIADDKITLFTEKKSFEIKVEDERGSIFGMKINKLNGEIDGADIKKKADKVVVLLKKIEERTWYKLEE
jgi:hypothetical protein